MRIRHQELEIDESNPFSTCKLHRQKYADILTDIVGSYSDGFVLAINNKWGTGKTTFLKMWQQHLINRGYKTVFFNAWESDVDSNSLAAIVAELKPLTTSKTTRAYKSVIQKGAAVAKAVLPSALKTLSKGVVDIETANTAIENLTKAATEAFDLEIKEYLKKKDSITGFRKQLEVFIEKTDTERPVIFIIDELDRCRPDYAVEILEKVKHFFSVRGIVFVLSIDKDHLAASICGYYGSEKINTDEYLRRFIDLEYSIPEPSAEDFCKYLYEYFSFGEFFKSAERFKHQPLRSDPEDFLRTAENLFTHNGVTLRQMEKVFARTRLILRGFLSNHYVMPDVLLFLVYLSAIQSDVYPQIAKNHLDFQELIDRTSPFFSNKDGRLRHANTMLLARLLVLYSKEFSGWPPTPLAKKGADDKWTTELHSDLEADDATLAESLRWIYQDWDKSDVKLGHLTGKIDLTESLNIST